MSDGNVALVRRLHDLFNGRDLEGMLELLHPEVEWVPVMGRLDGIVLRHGPDTILWALPLLVRQENQRRRG
jgi:ketosteroid isomerase-like protein